MATNGKDEYIDREFEVEKAPTIPAGAYHAQLEGISEVEATFDGKTSTRLRWHWVIPDAHPDGGDFRLSTFSALHLTDSPKSNFRKFVTALRGGKAPAAGENVNARSLYGKTAQLAVVLEDDVNKVEAVIAAAPAAPAATALDPEYAAFLAAKRAKEATAAEGDPATLPPAAPSTAESA